ncbi:hypothetical protein CYMTET_13132 [Cymbomonas tetramitiformis]|uniref:Uncharacterized protein n=1 Tax=Cymbomonas tetramitiformis TaxID=36881 RepID=A0AAE0GJ16_9CHLO|nr:hypothetical protein CYMTET_13132 [Cymbomonas tetramitiformis]
MLRSMHFLCRTWTPLMESGGHGGADEVLWRRLMSMLRLAATDEDEEALEAAASLLSTMMHVLGANQPQARVLLTAEVSTLPPLAPLADMWLPSLHLCYYVPPVCCMEWLAFTPVTAKNVSNAMTSWSYFFHSRDDRLIPFLPCMG